ncbi:MAG: hypothetical protein ACOYOT_04300 [Bacteroidales bacterium]
MQKTIYLLLLLLICVNGYSQCGQERSDRLKLYTYLNDSIIKNMSHRYGQSFKLDTAHHRLIRRYFGMSKQKGRCIETFNQDNIDLQRIDSIYSNIEHGNRTLSLQASDEQNKKLARTVTFYFLPEVTAVKATRYVAQLKNLIKAAKTGFR